MSAKPGMGKLMAILPVWYLSSKMDWEDAGVVTNLRIAYFFEQLVLLLLCAFLYFKLIRSPPDTTPIYHKKEKSFSDQSPRWIKTTYTHLELGEVSALVMQTMMGLAMTTVLHFYFGVKQSMLMQAAMQPVAFLEAPVVKKKLLGLFDKEGERAYGEKLEGEERAEDEDEGQDGDGKEDAALTGAKAPSLKSSAGDKDSKDEDDKDDKDEDEMPVAESSEQALARLIGETWDSGKHADYAPLFEALDKAVETAGDGAGSLVNTKSCDDAQATALMVVAAGVGDVSKHVQRLLCLGADVRVKDDEGWTALHWASFHGNLSGVVALVDGCRAQGLASLAEVMAAEDDEGCTCMALAKKELESATDELGALKAELKSDDPLSTSQLATKVAQVSTKRNILAVLEQAAAVAGGGGGAEGSEGTMNEEGLLEID
mmetsp:Transcript_26856/g.54980  ORF Transcript_26856/g.54980 Transcript_26856/m.54980 type:complete len:429 (-) Transcript_26856:386-1672(-)